MLFDFIIGYLVFDLVMEFSNQLICIGISNYLIKIWTSSKIGSLLLGIEFCSQLCNWPIDFWLINHIISVLIVILILIDSWIPNWLISIQFVNQISN